MPESNTPHRAFAKVIEDVVNPALEKARVLALDELESHLKTIVPQATDGQIREIAELTLSRVEFAIDTTTALLARMNAGRRGR
jgi:hypothetical protein